MPFFYFPVFVNKIINLNKFRIYGKASCIHEIHYSFSLNLLTGLRQMCTNVRLHCTFLKLQTHAN